MDISDKYLFFQDNDFKNIKKALLEKKLSGTSNIISEYEACLAEFFKSKYAVATSSGTSAIQTALFAVGVKSGDEVIVPPTCPSMTILPILQIGAKPVFCDTYENNFGLNIKDLRNKISSKTKAVIEVPMWGYPTNVAELGKLLKTKNTPFILDLAQAHGTRLNGKYLSYYSDLSCFSTHDRKILATGEGGFILTDNPFYKNKTKNFTQFGNMEGISFGLNFKLGGLQAALGVSRISNIQNQLNIRDTNAKYIVDGVKNDNVREFDILKNGYPNYYTLLFKLSFNNNAEFMRYLAKNGIPSDIIRYNYKVLYKYPLFKGLSRKCKNAESLVRSITTIPVHPGLTRKQLTYIVNKINSFKRE